MENDIREQKQELLDAYQETQAQAKVMKNQNKHLKEQEDVHERRNEQASKLNQSFREARRDYKEKKLE